jgi:hydrogenase maturation protease
VTEPRVLVAGVGNIFFGDDAFGVEVARRLADEPPAPDDVRVAEFGIRGVHLAYELLNGYDTLVLIDAISRGDPPGTVSVLEVPLAGEAAGDGVLEAMDAHGMNPGAVLAMVADMGGNLGRVLVVGCEPGELEDGIGLSAPVLAAVPAAVDAVRDLVDSLTKEALP